MVESKDDGVGARPCKPKSGIPTAAARFEIRRVGIVGHREITDLFTPALSPRPETVALRAVARHNLAVICPSGQHWTWGT